jgi:hypothetical protein
MSASPIARRAASLLVVILLIGTAAAANWTEPARQLARKVSAKTGPGAVAITFKNSSSLGTNDANEVRRTIEQQLRAAGLHFVPQEQSVASVHVTFSENAQGLLWVAEIREGAGEYDVAMVSVPQVTVGTAPRPVASVVIRKQVLWIQTEPILDIAVLEPGSPGSHLLVLSPDRVALYRQNAARWELAQEMPIQHAHPWPRDLRGRILPAKDHLFDVYLPGMACTTSGKGPFTLACRTTDDPWPITVADEPPQFASFGAQRNFFNGAIRPGFGETRSTAPFYSAAGLPRQNYTLWMFAGVDGALRLTDGVNERVIAPRGWGSDIAAVLGGCNGPQALITNGGDGNTPDSVVALDVAEREPAVVSDPLEFGGPVTALWSAGDGDSALAVSKNLKTGNYEAYALTLVCSQ